MNQPDLRQSYQRAIEMLDGLEAPARTQPARRRMATGSTPPPLPDSFGPDEETLVEPTRVHGARVASREPDALIDTRTWAAELDAAIDDLWQELPSAHEPAVIAEVATPFAPEVAVPFAPEALAAAAPQPSKILRFVVAERLLHWALAVPFMVCLLTAAALVFYFNPNPGLPYRNVVSWIHRVSGVCFIGLPLGVLLASPRYFGVFWENIKEGWIWTKRDLKWIALKPLAVLSSRIELPEEGKFNAGEKLNFMWTMASWPLYAATGVAIWLGGAFGEYGVYPWLIHCGLVLISLPLLLGHLFMAVVNPSTRKGLSGMFSGLVDRRWAKHHYRRWYKEKFGRADTEGTHHGPGGARAHTVSTFIQIGRAVSPGLIAFTALAAMGTLGAGAYLMMPGEAAATHGGPQVYVGAETPLYSAANEEAACVDGGPVVRGVRVEPLREDGDFVFVRDPRGRVGFLFAADLFAERPRFDPGAFAAEACGWAAGESDGGGCSQRAADKLRMCQLECVVGRVDACRRRCAEAHAACAASCELAPDTDGDDDE